MPSHAEFYNHNKVSGLHSDTKELLRSFAQEEKKEGRQRIHCVSKGYSRSSIENGLELDKLTC